jgi:hypothetical protein
MKTPASYQKPNGGSRSLDRMVRRWPLAAIPAVLVLWQYCGIIWPTPVLLGLLWLSETNAPNAKGASQSPEK